jgi:uncharacterized PurR-regulated membrane protein YhhQ (DUF165 family)
VKTGSYVYNPLNKLVRRIKDMRTKRDVYLILFAMMLAWIVATLQSYSNPNNWASFGSLHWFNWVTSVGSIVTASLVAFYLYRQAAKIDKAIDQAEKRN